MTGESVDSINISSLWSSLFSISSLCSYLNFTVLCCAVTAGTVLCCHALLHCTPEWLTDWLTDWLSLTYKNTVADKRLGCQNAHAHYYEGRSEVRNQLTESRVPDLACILELGSALVPFQIIIGLKERRNDRERNSRKNIRVKEEVKNTRVKEKWRNIGMKEEIKHDRMGSQ